MTATITYRPDAQKTPGLFDELLTREILGDICLRVTGQCKFRIEKDWSTYNRGRLLTVEYDGFVYYVSLSEESIEGRNSSLQSVPTAINKFYADTRKNKQLCYYFIPHFGNAFTDYHLFMYRLMKTAGIRFLNMEDYYSGAVRPYGNVDELISDRSDNQEANPSNNSSFVSKSIDKIQIYAKTYGANKYESTLLAVAVSRIADRPIDLFSICEKELKQLPLTSAETIEALGNISVHYTSLTLDKYAYQEQIDRTILRSPSYLYNLYNRIGYKKCALCGCEIPEIIQGAHVWGVAQIAGDPQLTDDDKFDSAADGNNGLWLCQNHHKLFDANILMIDGRGVVRVKDGLAVKDLDFVRNTTFKYQIDRGILSRPFLWYLARRNEEVDLYHSHPLAV